MAKAYKVADWSFNESKKCFVSWLFCMGRRLLHNNFLVIIESVDSISRDERGFPLTQYITNGRISRARYTITYFKHHRRVLRMISNRMSV